VKFPAVPVNKARLRVQLNAGHTRSQIDDLVDILDVHQDLIGADRSRLRVAPGVAAATCPKISPVRQPALTGAAD
jgi:hypothetical protein